MSKPYDGVLLEPIEPPKFKSVTTLTDTAENRAACAEHNSTEHLRVACEKTKRLLALATHYGVDLNSPGLWLSLAIALAEDHVPGMAFKEQIKTKPTTWGNWENILLTYRVNTIMHEKGCSVIAACRIAVQKYYTGVNAESLKRRYNEANKKPDVLTFLSMGEKLRNQGIDDISILKTVAEIVLKNRAESPE